MTENLDYLEELVVLGSVIILRGGGEMKDVWSQVDRRGDQLLPTELKMETEEYTANELYF